MYEVLELPTVSVIAILLCFDHCTWRNCSVSGLIFGLEISEAANFITVRPVILAKPENIIAAPIFLDHHLDRKSARQRSWLRDYKNGEKELD